MYINKIDDLIDKVIDDFYYSVILKHKDISKILKEQNFVKFQKEINSIMNDFINLINLSEIRELVKSSDAVYAISETLKRYVGFYIFLYIGFFYDGKDDNFINNIVEFSKNQPEYSYKINNFFNSESNSMIIKYNVLIKNILTLLNADQAKIDIIKKKPDIKEAILFLNQLPFDVDQIFRLENLENNKQTQAHNIIKTIIIILLYKVTEKKEFFRLLELTENLDGEYMFIDIVVPKQNYVDFNSIEKLIGSSNSVKNLSGDFWKFLTDYEQSTLKPPTTIEEKIILLIQSGLLYPICDDFLLYHKDSERYDKTVDPTKIKKKEDTKIRYIINKIETTSEFYSEQIKKDDKIKNNIKKNFYVPLFHRKAILVNNNEDVHIINKFLNQGKRSVENNEYFNDLLTYKTYPYINFKDFEKYGFSITLPKTTNVVRYVSVNKDGDFKQNSKNPLQLRVGTKDMTINVVGFLIPTNLRELHCVRSKDIINLRSLGKNNQNGFDLMINYLRESSLGTKPHNSSVYWIFDLEKDIVSEETAGYEQGTKHSIADQVKHIASTLYDNIINELYYIIIDNLEKHKNIHLQSAYKMLNVFQNKIMKIPNDSQIFNNIETQIFNHIIKVAPEYDKKEDIINGLSDDSIKLKEIPKSEKQKYQLVKINLSNITETGMLKNPSVENVDGICQHNVSWEKISGIQHKDPKLYLDILYVFIQQYVTENVDSEYICKSCGHQINIKKYITDGVFDDDTQKFVTYSAPMEVPLEDIPEYEKYKITIRNIEKIIDRIASICGLPHLSKGSSSIKWKRKAIVKDTIDLLLMNNRQLKSIFKERNENASKIYGINRDLSNLFVFELDNSIFVYSSKDKDQFKPLKQNNVLTYLIFLILIDINDSHVSLMGGDKKGLCNFAVFEKIFYSLFSGLKIRTNSKGNLTDITNYKILCYMIYIIGCSLSKYNMWYYEYPDPTKKNKYIPVIQKIFIHTLVDITNSILEFSALPGVHYIYQALSVKFFKKLNGSFNNEELYVRLKNEYKSSVIGEKKDYIVTKKKLVNLTGEYVTTEFDIPSRLICRMPRFIMEKKIINKMKYYIINNVTNCPDGQFHEWKPNGGNFVCKLCSKVSNIVHDKNESENILNNFKYVRLRNLSSKYCISDGYPHQYIISENDKMTCIKCNKTDDHKYSNKELDSLEKSIDNAKQQQSIELNNITTHIKNDVTKEITYVDKIYNSISNAYKTSSKNGQFKFINILLDELQSIIGNETGGSDIYLRENAYIINHDHLGYKLDKNVILTDNNNKIFYKQNHPFFKTDVIYYTSYKNGKIDIFYDATTKILLGYKEESKNFVSDRKQDKRLIVNYSILNKLKMLGYPSQFIDINEEYENQIKGKESKYIDNNIISKTIILNIIRSRIDNLKKVIYEFQRILFKIINNYTESIIDDDSEYFSNKLNMFVEKYKKKISSISIVDEKGNHSVFKHWKGVVRGIYATEIDDVKYNFSEQKTINIDDINKLDENGNLILFFIVEEFAKLLKYNSNKFVKNSIANFIIDFINTVFELFSIEKIVNNIDIKRFKYILSSATYIQEIMEKSGVKEIEGIYDEYKDPDQEITQEDKEELIDAEEEQDALDVEEESEGEYESGLDAMNDWAADH